MILAQAFGRFVFDLDGVVWRGDAAIPGAPETIKALRNAGKGICFVTNNSSETAAAYAAKLSKLGAGGGAEEIVSSADATARLVERRVPGARGRLTAVIGGAGLTEAAESIGLRIASAEEAAEASLVLVGLDRKLTFDKLKRATLAIRSGATFVASNTDATMPAPDGLWPGAGAIVAALRTATGVEPLVAGKPEPTVLEVAADRLGGGPALVVGDRVETDILAAQAMGWPAALVLTGATGVPELAVAPAWPELVIRRLPDLLEDRPHPQIRPGAGPDLPSIASMLHAGDLLSGAARERLGRTLIAEVDRTPIGTAAWEQVDGVALLRSVAVAPEQRRSGVGTLVTAAALRAVAAAGLTEVWLAAEAAEPFFTSCGFATIDRDDAPDAILQHPSVLRECSASAAVMRLVLPLDR